MPFSDYSNVASGTVPLLVAPSSLVATMISATQIDLAWTDNSTGEATTRVERSPNGTSGWVEIDSVGPNVTSYSNTGLDPETTYYYRVRAAFGPDFSAYSNVASATTGSAGGPPTANMLWNIDANAITPQTDNTALSVITDSAPTPHNLQSPGTNGGTQVKYRTAASPAAINGNPVIQVAAGNQADMPFPNFSPRRNDTSFTAYWLGRYTSPQSGAGVLLFTYRTAPADGVIRLYLDGLVGANVGYEYDVGAGTVDVNVAAATSGVQVLSFVFDKAANTAKLYRNGTQIGSTGTIGGASPNKGWDWGDDFIEFFAVGGGSSAIVGEHNWFIGYAAAHDDTTRNTIEALLKARGGLPP